ncbi:hypothetical protein AXF42_Ash016948 [Apostasia shenzhenica]|uniref:Uncharacterized protein n=1 Tax=Apostasia shenzhenica TaxID=1088818 RepID=A0A2H9ZRJ9_9ASPA|nr:hypothetical protein AXF42_Ash016948 [Apostasia shenzhenica]
MIYSRACFSHNGAAVQEVGKTSALLLPPSSLYYSAVRAEVYDHNVITVDKADKATSISKTHKLHGSLQRCFLFICIVIE